MRVGTLGLALAAALWLPPDDVAAQSALDKNAQRIVNEASRDLKGRDAKKRADAVDRLATWGGPQTLPLVVGALSDIDAGVRAAAAEALWDEKMKSETARAPLTKALDDTSADVAVLAAGALRLLGVTDAALKATHERALASATDRRIRFLAARSLIGLTAPPPLVAPLAEYLENQATANSSQGVDAARAALERLVATKDRAVVAPLLDAVTRLDRGSDVIVRVVGPMQVGATGWTTFLIAQSARSNHLLRRAVVDQMRLQTADRDTAQWTPVAARLLATDTDSGVRLSAAAALGAAGGAAHTHAGVVLTAARKDADANVRDFAFDALAEIVGRLGTAPMAVKTAMATSVRPEALAAIAGDSNQDVRESAMDALDALALDSREAAMLLVGIASNTTTPEALRTKALRKLRNRGSEARSVMADVDKLRNDPNAAVRTDAAEALERMGAGAAAPATAAGTTRVAAAPAARTAAAPNADAEARGLSILRRQGIAFDKDQFFKALMELDEDVSRAFLDAGMSANVRFSDRGDTPLLALFAREACSPAVRPTATTTLGLLRLIVERGGDASVADGNGNTPLMQAAMIGCDAAVMSALVKAGGQVGAKNSAGLTAFEFGLFAAHDGLDALVAAGYKLPADKVKMYLDAYKANPKAVSLIQRAAP